MIRVLVCVLLVSSRAFADAPRDYSREVRTLYAVAACGEAPPAAFDAKVVAAHCKRVQASIESWKTKWLAKASPFFAELLKGGYPSSVVYPFGGGDLATLLAVYPDATEYTTLSLEGMGDPRPIDKLSVKELGKELGTLRGVIDENLSWAWNTTIRLSNDSSSTGAGLPRILALVLVALVANGYEPLEARFWRPDGKGAVVYVTADPPAAATGKKDTNALQQGAFNDIEIVFRKVGDPKAPRKVFRHLAADLSDAGIKADGGALAHLGTKREVAAMTKAASYLLWKDSFSQIRDYLLAHMKQMISDDTGIAPRHANPAGFTQEVWGTYTGSHFSFANQDVAKEMVALWKPNKRPLPFRFGYYDNHDHPHLLYTHR
jgi:hypothetical protein